MKKAFLFAILVSVLCLGLALFPASAEGETVGAPDNIGAPELPIPTIPTDNWLDYAEEVTEQDGVYEITKPEQLAWIAKQVVILKSDFFRKTVKLLNDIDLSAHLWTPIGCDNMPFYGDFDGQNHTIRGLIITDDAQAGDYVGLFGYASDNCLKNTTIADAYINVTSAFADYSFNFCVGALAGRASFITNCNVINSMVTGSGSDFYAGVNVGGLVGRSSSITNCEVSKTAVTGSGVSGVGTGGFAGYAGITTNCRVANVTVTGGGSGSSSNTVCTGGFAGGIDTATNCNVSSTMVTGSGNGYSFFRNGGLAGAISSSAIANCAVSNTTVSGGISHKNATVDIGGLVGEASNSSITSCAVSGVALSVKGTNNYSYAGGLCGSVYNDGSISNSFAIVSLTIESGTLSVGGIAGINRASVANCYACMDTGSAWYGIARNNYNSVRNCYYSNTASRDFDYNTGSASGCKAMTDTEMKDDAFVSALNGYWDEVTDENKYRYWEKDVESTNSGFPILLCPKAASFEFVAPSFHGGPIQFKLHGENFDKADAVSVYNNSSNQYLDDAVVANASLITASDIQYGYTKTIDGYPYGGTVYLTVDGVKVSEYSYSGLISAESKVTALSYENTLPSSGGVVEFTLMGEYLADFYSTITLTATSATEILHTTEKVSRDGDTIRMRLAFPDNIGWNDKVYTLSVSLESTDQNLSGYALTVKAPSGTEPENDNSFDLNKDGFVNVTDVILLMRKILRIE